MMQAPDSLIQMTRALGEPSMDYVVVGEGNTSHRVDADTLWIKASGQTMHNIAAEGFVAVRLAPILALLEQPVTANSQVNGAMEAAKVDPAAKGRPSVEVTFHAMLLAECGVGYVGHTHPIAVNRILCSARAQQFALNRMFPDEVVLCGPQSAFVEYADPGLPLASAIQEQVRRYMEAFDEAPKVILLANHGLIALGDTPSEVLNITAMCVKAAHIFAGACAIGEPVFMSEADIMHIYRRPDEIYRRKRFVHE